MSLELMDVALLAATALAASFVAAVAGGGVTVILLPVLVLHFGIHVAMPIVTIALVAASASRVAAYRREIVPRIVGWFSLGSLPLTALGTYLFTITAPDLLTRVLGGFLLAAVLWRRTRARPPAAFPAPWFFPLGAVFGFLTGISAAVAAVLAPFFLGYGLRKGAYVGTVGLNVLLIQFTKLAVFSGRDFLLPEVLAYGAMLVPCMVVGTLLGKRAMERISEHVFVVVIEGVMVISGLNFLLRGAA